MIPMLWGGQLGIQSNLLVKERELPRCSAQCIVQSGCFWVGSEQPGAVLEWWAVGRESLQVSCDLQMPIRNLNLWSDFLKQPPGQET